VILLATILLILGLLFILLGVVGILRLPDFYSRLHAMGKCDTLGVTLI
jgi:multicomponent Na+:H+ antiporter subunit G